MVPFEGGGLSHIGPTAELSDKITFPEALAPYFVFACMIRVDSILNTPYSRSFDCGREGGGGQTEVVRPLILKPGA